MASEDVIELGSSDEEAEPAPKKRKPMPNAMVHIPGRLPGLSIKPSKSRKTPGININPLSFAKGPISKSVTVTRIHPKNVANAATNKKVPNGTPIKVAPPKLPAQVSKKKTTLVPARHSSLLVNPIKVAPPAQTFTPSVSGKQNRNVPIPSITKLPPGITVKRTSTMVPNPKRKVFIMTSNQLNKKSKATAKKNPIIVNSSELFTVDLDDDDSPSPAPASEAHQWYIRPEDQTKSDNNVTKQDTSIEIEIPKDNSEASKENLDKDKPEESTDNSEEPKDKPEEPKDKPEKPKDKAEELKNKAEEPKGKPQKQTNYIEITIEDSPVKPISKRHEQIGEELAITIDDSPVKHTPKKKSLSGSDDERSKPRKHPHSKKKLNYPKETVNTVEIEIEPIPVQNSEATEQEKENNNEVHIIEIEESPLKTFESKDLQSSTPNKVKNLIKTTQKPLLKITEIRTLSNDTGEFHPTYQKFIDLCFQLENSEDMNKIVEKKIKAYYRQVPKEYTESEAFLDMVASKITAIKAGPEKMYLYIKDVVDELNLQRKLAKAQPEKDPVVEEQEKFLYGEDSEFDSKRQRQIRKLEKTLKKLHRAIQILEEQEVDFDDDDDSVYLLTERYKERMVRVHAKFCQLTNTKMPSEPRVQIDPRPGQPKGPAKKLEKRINKKVPIGTPLPFPDFHDVLRCVRDANDEDKLGWNEADIMDEARDLFTRCGRKLQRRRQENEWRLAASRIATDVDPAEESEELKKMLENNRRFASVRESEVLNKYADRQNLLKLEAVEIGDKEADESPEESDEDEVGEETSLENKEKRKERIKRLLHDKLKKVSKDTVKEPDNTKNQEASTSKEAATLLHDKLEKVSKDTVKEPDNTEIQEASTSKEAATDVQETEPEVVASVTQNEDKDPLADANPPKEQDKSETNVETEVHSLSDDSKNLDSDVDELHLLQKLHSPNEDDSSLETSDSDSPIAISDTLSSGDNKKHDSDVISIENSSFSESEDKGEDKSIKNKCLSDINEEVNESSEVIQKEHDKTPESKDPGEKCDVNTDERKQSANAEIETELEKESACDEVETELEKESASAEIETESQKEVETMIYNSTNDEYNESIEGILLMSSDDEVEPKNPEPTDKIDIESKEADSITITTTESIDSPKLVEKDNSNTQQNNSSPKLSNKMNEEKSDKNSSPDNEGCINLRDEVISIGETVIEEKTCTANITTVIEKSNGDKTDLIETEHSENADAKDNADAKESNNVVEAKSLDVSEQNDNLELKETESNNFKSKNSNEISDKIEESSAQAMDFDLANETLESNDPKDNINPIISEEKEQNNTQAMDVDIAQDV